MKIGFSITQFGVRISNVAKTTSDIQQIKSQPPVPINISDQNPSNIPLLLDHPGIRCSGKYRREVRHGGCLCLFESRVKGESDYDRLIYDHVELKCESH